MDLMCLAAETSNPQQRREGEHDAGGERRQCRSLPESLYDCYPIEKKVRCP